MFTAIARVLGYSSDNAESVSSYIQRVQGKVTKQEGEPGFEDDVFAAADAVDAEGSKVLTAIIGQLDGFSDEKPYEYKIKRVAKGQRIKVASASGKNFAFGPVWCQAIRAAKGIVLNENNREKLNMHGMHVGVVDPEKMTARELCAAISKRMPQDEAAA